MEFIKKKKKTLQQQLLTTKKKKKKKKKHSHNFQSIDKHWLSNKRTHVQEYE